MVGEGGGRGGEWKGRGWQGWRMVREEGGRGGSLKPRLSLPVLVSQISSKTTK